jgi:hypothetical protein
MIILILKSLTLISSIFFGTEVIGNAIQGNGVGWELIGIFSVAIGIFYFLSNLV